MPHPAESTDETALWASWQSAGRDPAIDQKLRALYEELAADIASRGPTCWISGRCCSFNTFGHRLYVTGLETAWLVDQLDDTARKRLADADLPDLDGCPFQVDKLCTVHALRPLGCRIFFCDPTAADWQNPVYEDFLKRLQQLHHDHAVEYQYLEWRHALQAARAVLT